MRIYRLLSTAIGGVLFAGVSSAAHAGCFGAPAPNCNPAPISHPAPVSYPAPMDRLAPVNTYGQNPYGHLRTVEYKNTPNVNVMRLRSRGPMVRLNDGPSGLTGDCNPTGVYCGAPQGRPVQGRPVNVTFAPAPQYVAPPAPVQPRVTIGSGYNPAAFAPRQYGSTDFVPGIAHVPTSIVDRSPITHIDGVPQPTVRSITTAPMSAPMMAAPMMPAPMTSYSTNRSYVANTMPTRRPAGNVIGNVVTNQYSYQPASGGAYWEKASGPTIVDGLPATQILCRREAPRPAPVNVRVVSPVIGVPYPVPTPVPVAVNTCGSAYGNGFAAPTLAGGPSANRYGSRWTY